MYKKIKNKNKLLYLTKTSNFSFEESVDLILSPELYWVRIFDIPLPNEKQVLSVVSTFFEDFIDVENYKYYIKKQEDNKYLCFAYDESQIIDLIKSAGLNLSQVGNIHFAQNEFKSFPENEFVSESSFKIDDSYYIYQDNILIKVPSSFISPLEVQTIDLELVSLSKYKISINYNSKYIDLKSIYILSVVFIFISAINFGKLYVSSNSINDITNEQAKIKEEYKMMPTIMQTKSVLKTFEKTEKQQLNLRKELVKVFNSKKKNITKVSVKNYKVSYE